MICRTPVIEAKFINSTSRSQLNSFVHFVGLRRSSNRENLQTNHLTILNLPSKRNKICLSVSLCHFASLHPPEATLFGQFDESSFWNLYFSPEAPVPKKRHLCLPRVFDCQPGLHCEQSSKGKSFHKISYLFKKPSPKKIKFASNFCWPKNLGRSVYSSSTYAMPLWYL